ncbi:MAG: hypothetical protein JSS83_27210 [Cyanobacteria bacterium SZAS LIN-3]|nr:hypothetical protein [Cyanobacteria bacterium SZAS LIN-3]MBS2005714.1 hypothetical protein [Cyanobacteria bacterium SZAS TMP-1]
MRSAGNQSHPRRQRGTTMSEMPVALWLIVLMCFPLLIVATSSLRFGFFWNAARETAMQAAKCQTFQNDSSVGISAVNTADLWATKATASFPGITVVPPVNVYIVQTNVISGATTKNANRQKLAAAADTDNNIYDIQVEINGLIEPLVRVPMAGIAGPIPGITEPFPIVVRSQYTAEVPQGLNK